MLLQALYGTPVVAQGMVLLSGYNGTLYALSLSDGGEKWEKTTVGHMVGGPAVSGDTVYVGSGDHCLYAFALSNGDERFSPFCTGAKIWSTPVVDNGIVYVSSMDRKVYAIDASTGELRWDKPFQASGAIASTPVVANGTVYVGTLDNSFYALDASNGEMRWRYKADDWIWNRAVATADTVYFGTLGGSFYALDTANGQLRWDKPFRAAGEIRGGAALVGSRLVVADESGFVYGLNASDGSQVWSSPASAGVPSDMTVNGDVAYYATKSGNIEKVDPADGTISIVQTPK